MDDTPISDSSELSPEDLAVLQAFYAMDDTDNAGTPIEHTAAGDPLGRPESGEPGAFDLEEDMLALFATEADEDISTMRRALEQLEQDEQVDSPHFVSLKRTAHKLKGTAGAVGCEAMSAIAQTIETEIKQIKHGQVEYLTGLMLLVHGLSALETTLQSVILNGREDRTPLQDFLADIAAFNGEPQAPQTSQTPPLSEELPEAPGAVVRIDARITQEAQPASSLVRVDARHLQSLLAHTEQLIEQRTPLESLRKQVVIALRELQVAQTRLRRLEILFSTLPLSASPSADNTAPLEEHPSSSLVARILYETMQRTGHTYQFKGKSHLSLPSPEMALWDEMEMDRFTEAHVLAHSFSEAVADVATASSQLRQALVQSNALLQLHMTQAELVRRDALCLRSAPFSILQTRVQKAVQMIAQAQKQEVHFESSGETTEIDQDILDALATPFLQLVRNCVADGLLSSTPHMYDAAEKPLHRIWLRASATGSEVIIELGFSMPVPGGALDSLSDIIAQLHGTVGVQRNQAGGVTYQLRFPSSQGVVRGLLARAGGQGVVIPFAQVRCIDYKQQEPYDQLYMLSTLLGFPTTSTAPANYFSLSSVLLLEGTSGRVAVQTDEIAGEVELVVKPLAPHLRRPGVIGTAISGAGDVLLILDLPELIRRQNVWQRLAASLGPLSPSTQQERDAARQYNPSNSPTVLVADDSVYIRQSLHQTLERAGYRVLEARDGIEALEQISEKTPHILLLDIEMPNLNGYDLLSIMRAQPLLASCKTILLTSRSSEKHRQRAKELGAHAFLSKPCPQDVLLSTISKALTGSNIL